MRKLLKEINIADQKYVFDGTTFELYRITDEEVYKKFQEEEDEKICKYTVKSHRSKIVFNFSNNCNLKCKYCYANGGKYATKRGELMTREVFDGLIARLVEEGVEKIDIVSFFGGEPLLNYELIKYALPTMQQKFQIGTYEIVTNAWYLNREKLSLFQEYKVRLVISCDGPEDITDYLRGAGTYQKVMQAYELAKLLGYDNVSMSSTYTKKHAEKGYSYSDIVNFFEKKGIESSVSRVLSSDGAMIPQETLTFEDIKREIDHGVEKILSGDKSGNINPYLYRVLLSMVFGARSFGFCDELSSKWQVSYDYDGKAYNCFHFWGDEKFALSEKEETVESVLMANEKERIGMCRDCWSKYFCKVCTAAVMQGTYELFPEKGKCMDQDIYEYVIYCSIRAMERGQLNDLLRLFEENFVTYKA